MSKVRIGIIGSRFQADCIAASVKAMPEEMEVVAVASPTKGNAEAFLGNLAENVCFTVIGTTRFSGTFNGKQELSS